LARQVGGQGYNDIRGVDGGRDRGRAETNSSGKSFVDWLTPRIGHGAYVSSRGAKNLDVGNFRFHASRQKFVDSVIGLEADILAFSADKLSGKAEVDGFDMNTSEWSSDFGHLFWKEIERLVGNGGEVKMKFPSYMQIRKDEIKG
jgi:hypothetical protein